MTVAFTPNSKARADLSPGALYAIDGGAGWIYYGQLGADKTIGCFRFRTTEPASAAEVLRQPLMFRVPFIVQTLGQALREGRWRKMGRHPLHSGLLEPMFLVQWPVATLTVTVHRDHEAIYDTRVEDPRIQMFELYAVWADCHLPARLVADFGAEPGDWHVGGPIWRERRIKEENARRHPDEPWHQLPDDWVPTARH